MALLGVEHVLCFPVDANGINKEDGGELVVVPELINGVMSFVRGGE